MRWKSVTIRFAAIVIGCTAPTVPNHQTPASTPAVTATLLPSAITNRGSFPLGALPGIGRSPVALALLDGKVYVLNSRTNNLAVIQGNRVVKFIPVGSNPGALAVDAASKRLYVSNAGDKSVALVANDQLVLSQSIGDAARTILLFDNRLFVGLTNKGTILVLDPATLQIQSTLAIPNAFTIINLAGDSTHNRLYANVFDRTAVIDAKSLRIVSTIPLKGSYHSVAAHPPTESVLIAAYDAESQAQYLRAYDMGTGKERGSVKIGGDPRDAVMSVDGMRLYVANSFTRDVSVIDPRDLRVLATIPVGKTPTALAFNDSAQRLYAANYDSDSISVIDTRTHQVTATIALGMNVTALAANERTGRVYVANASSDSMFVIEGTRIMKEIGVGRHPIDITRDDGGGRLLVANQADNTLTIIDETTLNARSIQTNAQALSTIALDSASRVFASEAILDTKTLGAAGRMTMRGVTIGSVITPLFVRVNPNNQRVYALGSNGIPGSNGRIALYSIDGTSLQQRAMLAFGGNVESFAIDPISNRVYLAGTHPLALTHEFAAFDADDSKIISFALPARTKAMVYNPQTRHLFLAHAHSPTRAGMPGPSDNTIQVLDVTTFGEVALLSVNAPRALTRLGNTIYVAGDDGTMTLIEDANLPAPPAPSPTSTSTPFPSATPAR